MGIRPSELYGIDWPLAAYYLDITLQAWSDFVEGKMNEAGAAIAATAVGRSSQGQAFIYSARQSAFAKLVGLPEHSGFQSVTSKGKKGPIKPKTWKRSSGKPIAPPLPTKRRQQDSFAIQARPIIQTQTETPKVPKDFVPIDPSKFDG